MDILENKPAAPQPDLSELQAQCESLRQLVSSLLIILVVISGTLNIFFLRQYRTAQTEVTALRQLVADYNKVSAPVINDFVKKLVDFEKKNPDFTPIILKYGVRASGPTGAVPAAAASPITGGAKK